MQVILIIALPPWYQYHVVKIATQVNIISLRDRLITFYLEHAKDSLAACTQPEVRYSTSAFSEAFFACKRSEYPDQSLTIGTATNCNHQYVSSCLLLKNVRHLKPFTFSFTFFIYKILFWLHHVMQVCIKLCLSPFSIILMTSLLFVEFRGDHLEYYDGKWI